MALFPVRSAVSALLVRGEYQDWTFDDTLSLSAVTGVAGLRRSHTPLLSSEVEVGAVETRDARTGVRESRAAWTVGITGLARVLGLPLESRVRVGQGAALTGEARVSRSLSGVGLSAGWTRSLEADGGAFDVPAIRDFATVGFEDSLSSGTVVSVLGSYGRWRPRQAAGERIETFRASGSVARALGPWLSGRMTYSYLRQEPVSGEGFHRARADFALTALFR